MRILTSKHKPPETERVQGNRLRTQRGVIDIIFGDVLVVFARFRATAVVTLRCSKLSDMETPDGVLLNRSLDTEAVIETTGLTNFIIVVETDFDVFEDAQGIIGQDGGREVQGEQVRRDAKTIQTHQAG